MELLEAAGWAVRLESGGCCGRASFSKGLLDDARRRARGLTARLVRSSQPGSPIVGCEPSCILTLRDEHRQLLPDDPNVRDVSGRVRQVEELLVEAIDAGRLRLGESALSGRLFPAIRAESADTVVAATGVSCRQQIRHGTQRVAWHPLELVRQSVSTG